MNTHNKQHASFSRKLIALAVLMALNTAYAAESDEIMQLIKPESSVSVGLGVVTGDSADRAQFGLYNGMREKSVYGLFDFDYLYRDDATGTWTSFQGHNLGLESHEANFSQQKQGDWKYFIDYSNLVRHNPYTINTAELNAGTTAPTVVLLATPGTGANLETKITRERIGLGVDKWIMPSLQLEVNFKNEDKDGARLFGKGFNCSNNTAGTSTSGSGALAAGVCLPAAGVSQWALLMLPEPINSNTKQLEVKLNFVGDKLNINAGYYGSLFTNSYNTLNLTVPGTLNNPQGTPTALLPDLQAILGLPTALPPDNQAHQLYVAGNYAFTQSTKATFKYSYTHATQNEDFASAGLTGAPAGVTNLGGVLDTTLAQVGVTTHPMPRLSVLANLRYEDKKDKTPIEVYNIEGATTFTNSPGSLKKMVGKVEASYRLPDNYRATLGVDFESKDRSLPISTTQVAGLSALREKTEETGYRAELRRAMSETLSGSISYSSSKRSGSDWYSLASATYGQILPDSTMVAASANTNFPSMLVDRQRDKWKLMADWTPTEAVSLQFLVEDGKDKNTSAGIKGWRDTGVTLYSLDAALTLSERWKLTGYASHGDQTLHINHSNGYVADLNNLNDTIGIGFIGKPSGKIELGMNLMYANDTNRYGQSLNPALSAANLTALATTGGLPDVVFRQTTLRLYSLFTLEKNSALRLDLIHQRTKLDEWTWGYNGVPFAYSDNTTISQQTEQNVTFLGVTYIYKWQ